MSLSVMRECAASYLMPRPFLMLLVCFLTVQRAVNMQYPRVFDRAGIGPSSRANAAMPTGSRGARMWEGF
jgi:hypothetical protein